MRKIYFIYNPHSGKEQIGSKLNEIIRTLAEKDNELTVVPTIGYLDAMERIMNLKDGYDQVVCSGGDGTLDEVVTGMMKRPVEKRIPIGYIPAGTTNDFAKSLEIPRNMVEAARTAMLGKPFACDIGSFNDDSVKIPKDAIYTKESSVLLTMIPLYILHLLEFSQKFLIVHHRKLKTYWDTWLIY